MNERVKQESEIARKAAERALYEADLRKQAAEIRAVGTAAEVATESARTKRSDRTKLVYPPLRPGPVEDWA